MATKEETTYDFEMDLSTAFESLADRLDGGTLSMNRPSDRKTLAKMLDDLAKQVREFKPKSTPTED
jgi:hypothetical protein